MSLPNFIPLLPEIFVAIMLCIILLASLFLPKFKGLPYYLTQLTLILVAWLTWYSYGTLDLNHTVTTFSGTFMLDKLAVVLKTFIYLAVFITFIYSRRYNKERHIDGNDFYLLGLLSTLGMMFLVSSHNLITLYLGLELMSLPIYAMVALQRGKMRCIEAAMKYFVIGALASGLLLYGLSMLFGATGSLDITQIAKMALTASSAHHIMMVFGLAFVLGGLAFKLGAAPFHMWVPDVYDGAPTSVTLFLSSAPKLAAFALMVRLLVDAMPPLSGQWSQILIVMAILSMAIGNIVAIVQTNIKRMLAYSSISHIGYAILGLVCATSRGYAAAMFYMISYTLMTLGAFGIVALMSREGLEANDISDYAGLNSRSPWLAFMMLLVMFSMAGIPPIIGFIAKVGIFEALIQVHLVWLSVVAVLFAIIGAYYYIRVIKVMYFEEPKELAPVLYATDTKFMISLNGVGVLLLGIFPGALFALSHVVF